MRQALLSCAIGLACVASAASASSGSTSPPSRAVLTGALCERAANPLDRAVGVTAVMRPITGTQQLEMRFVLLRRPSGASAFTPVRGGDLGRWLRPKSPTLGQRPSDVWRLKKLVVNLAAPSNYRFRVTFQWLDASGVTLQRTTLQGTVCDQPQ